MSQPLWEKKFIASGVVKKLSSIWFGGKLEKNKIGPPP